MSLVLNNRAQVLNLSETYVMQLLFLPADLAVLGSRPTGVGKLSNHKQGSIAHSLTVSLSDPDMDEILLKRT